MEDIGQFEIVIDETWAIITNIISRYYIEKIPLNFPTVTEAIDDFLRHFLPMQVYLNNN